MSNDKIAMRVVDDTVPPGRCSTCSTSLSQWTEDGDGQFRLRAFLVCASCRDAITAATARAERAEAAIQRVRKLANGWSFIDDESVTVDELRDQILAALDSTDPPPDAQRPEERSDEGPKKPTPPCPHCGPGYRYGDEGCRHMIPPSDAGLPADGEERK